jgi:hypothetical protein
VRRGQGVGLILCAGMHVRVSQYALLLEAWLVAWCDIFICIVHLRGVLTVHGVCRARLAALGFCCGSAATAVFSLNLAWTPVELCILGLMCCACWVCLPHTVSQPRVNCALNMLQTQLGVLL